MNPYQQRGARFAKKKGTMAETAVADYLHDRTGVEAMRRVQYGGGNDRGDVNLVGVPVMVEIKNTKRPNLPKWSLEVERQRINASCDYGVLIWSPPGLGLRSIDRWVAIEWQASAISPFRRSGVAYSGTATALADTLAPMFKRGETAYVRDPADPGNVLWARLRTLSAWTADLGEFIAARAAEAR